MKRTGFALLEAAVSLAVIGVVAIGALEAFGAEARAAHRARVASVAVAVASEQLAQLALLDAHELTTIPDSLRSGRLQDGTLSYAWHAQAARVPNETGLYTLHIDVQWDGGSYALDTRAFRPTPGAAR